MKAISWVFPRFEFRLRECLFHALDCSMRLLGEIAVLLGVYKLRILARDPPIMLTILPIMLCCTVQKFTYYACIYAQYLPIMLNYLCLSSHALLIISSLWINDKWLKH